jgi:hypothetical protein
MEKICPNCKREYEAKWAICHSCNIPLNHKEKIAHNIIMKKCPFCAEDILKDATVCKHCRKELCERKGWGSIFFGCVLIMISPFAYVAGSVALALGWSPAVGVFAVPLVAGLGCGCIIDGIVKLCKPVSSKRK